MYESKQVEFKETVTNTYLKTVSAFSNYSGGKIYFGVKDDGEKIELQNLDQTCLDIENRINDSISPKPDYIFDIDRKNNIIILEVLPGKFKPYLYKSKAYKRNGTSTIEVDRIELTRLILEGQNMSYDELSSNEKSLTFNELENKLREVYKINSINDDILKILQLYDINQNYNNAAQLLADNNNYPGVDIVRFGESINIILDRVTIEKTSILHQYEKAIEIYRQYYQYEEISGIERKKLK
jgi:ATP-dependent DNA helicase RecG